MRKFAPSAPEINGKGDRHERENGTKFVDEPSGFSSVAGQGSEDPLDVEIVTGMQESAGPQAA